LVFFMKELKIIKINYLKFHPHQVNGYTSSKWVYTKINNQWIFMNFLNKHPITLLQILPNTTITFMHAMVETRDITWLVACSSFT
jgi:hypothetical protein